MALINCPECRKQVSDKANACPNCGYPIKEILKSEVSQLKMPIVPKDLSIGKPLFNWLGDALFKGEYIANGNNIQEINPGKVRVWVFEKGIGITNKFLYNTGFHIHNSLIIKPLRIISRSELCSQTNDVTGKSAIGEIFVPIDAVIAALTTQKTNIQFLLKINYWNIKSRKPKTLFIGGDKFKISSFIRRYENEFG